MARLPLASLQTDVATLFLALFQRAPELEAMQWYVQAYASLLAAQGDHANAQEAAYQQLADHLYADGAHTGELPPANTITNTQYVESVFQNLLGRAPSETVLAAWVAGLDGGEYSRGAIPQLVLEAAGTDARDTLYVQHRSDVSLAFAQWQNSNPVLLPSLAANAAEVLQGVNENPATVELGLQRLHDYSPQGGDTFDLTAAVDVFQGTDGNDVFQAYTIDPPTGDVGVSTLTAGDRLDGGAGTDTLNLFSNGSTGANGSPPANLSIRNIEIVNLIHTDDTPASLLGNASLYQGVRELWQSGGAADVTRLQEGTVAGFRGVDHLDVSVVADPGARLIHLALDDPGYTGTDVKSFPAVHALGAALAGVVVDGTLGGHAALRLDVTAASGLESFQLQASLDTILGLVRDAQGQAVAGLDASASSANVFLTLERGTNSVLGGSGDDVFEFVAGALRSAVTLDGGEGFNTVLLHDTQLQTSHYTALRSFANIQAVGFTAEHVEFDAARLSEFKWLVFSDPLNDIDRDTDATIHNLASDQTLMVDTHDTSDIRLANAAANVDVRLNSDSWVDLWVVVGQEGSTGGVLTFTGEAGGDADYDNTRGWDLVTDSSAELSQGKFAVIDAAGLQGNLTLWGMAAGLAEVVHLGSGNENFIFVTVGVDGSASSSSIGLLDTLVGFDSADTELVGVGSSRLELQLAPGTATLALAFREAAEAFAEAQPDVVYFHFEGDTYLYADTDGVYSGLPGQNDFGLRIVGEHDLA